MLQAIAKSALDLDALGSARALFRLRQPVDLVYASMYVKGLLLLVPPPRSGGYDVYIHAVYVVICYMSITCICLLYVVICYMSVICYVSVMCLVLASSCYMYMSVMCWYMLYVCDMLYVCYVICLVLGGVVRVRLYIIYAHLCNHILLQSGWWDHSSVHCRGVGSGSRDVDAWRANGSVRRGSGARCTDGPGAWPRHLQLVLYSNTIRGLKVLV
jgi:hypothetical protein